MGTKLVQLEQELPTGEPVVQLVHPGFGHLDQPGIKTASEALNYIKDVQPIPGKTIILVLAMTAGDYYGPNRNGDAWPERPLQVGSTKIGPESVLPKHYKTFESHAKVYRHHINKDPKKSIGDVMQAFYNWLSHRVELLLMLDNDRASDIVSGIQSGKTPAVSMGCRVPFDVCSRCGNKAPTRREYCSHARKHLGEILPDGQVFVWNPDPLFFDISGVLRPAERLGWMMRKVAGSVSAFSSDQLGEQYLSARDQAANLRKLAIINNMVRGEEASDDPEANVVLTPDFVHDIAERAAETSAPIPDNLIRRVLAYRPAELFSTLSRLGIVLTTPEFIKYFVWKVAPEAQIPEEFLRRAVAMQGLAFEFLAENPGVLEDIVGTGMFDEVSEYDCDPEIKEAVAPALEKRSQLGDYLYRNMMPEVFKPSSGKGQMDLLTIRDPRTGRSYETTRSAANAGADWSAEHQLMDLAGGGLLGAAAYKLFKMPKLRFLAPIAGIGAAGLGYRGLAGYPSVRATTGESVALPRERMPWEPRHGLTGRGGTEMVEKRSSVHDGIAAIVAMQDLAHVGMSARPGARPPLAKNASWLNFDEAAHWFGSLVVRGE